ncbi:hypothetical protein BGX34_006315 [Mortierella sp. NVP85]|nr:hypothetical protein BGX34_006315 [Mortierella sp. NVP85]
METAYNEHSSSNEYAASNDISYANCHDVIAWTVNKHSYDSHRTSYKFSEESNNYHDIINCTISEEHSNINNHDVLLTVNMHNNINIIAYSTDN